VEYARVAWRAFLHDRFRVAGFVRLIKPVMREGHEAEAVMSLRRDPKKAGNGFPKGSRLNTNVQQQSGSLGETGKVPVI
jgi:hypothetical protein